MTECPIDTKNHKTHDNKIIELTQICDTFRISLERTPRILAEEILKLQTENIKLHNSLAQIKERIDKHNKIRHPKKEITR